MKVLGAEPTGRSVRWFCILVLTALPLGVLHWAWPPRWVGQMGRFILEASPPATPIRLELIELAGMAVPLGSEVERTLVPRQDLRRRFRWSQVGQANMTIRVRVVFPETSEVVEVVRTIAPKPRNQCLMWLAVTAARAALTDCAAAGPDEHGY